MSMQEVSVDSQPSTAATTEANATAIAGRNIEAAAGESLPASDGRALIPARIATRAYTNEDFNAAKRHTSRTWQEPGAMVYDAFGHINRTIWDDRLSLPYIFWGLTAHGRCLGYTQYWDKNENPTVCLHPSLLGGKERANPWNVQPQHLTWRFAYDVLLHESIHMAVMELHGGSSGATSHDCKEWIEECSRIAPLIGLGLLKFKRRKPTRRGKAPTYKESEVPFKHAATFPHGIREWMSTMDYYESKQLPWES